MPCNLFFIKSTGFVQDLLTYLGSFLTDERKKRIETVLSNRLSGLVLVLEDIHDPHNAAACLRSADACGVQDVHIIEQKNRFQLKEGVSLGSGGWLSLHRWNQTDHCLKSLSNSGFTIVATTPHRESVQIGTIPIDRPLAIVMGSEHSGISEKALELADLTLTVPMFGFAESFNLSVCTALVLYQLSDRLRTSNRNVYLSEEKKEQIKLRWYKKNIRNVEAIIERYHSNRS